MAVGVSVRFATRTGSASAETVTADAVPGESRRLLSRGEPGHGAMEVDPERPHLEHPPVFQGQLGDPLAVGVRAVAAAKVREEILPPHAEDFGVEP